MTKKHGKYGYNLKTARLCDESMAIAAELNFSRWAREALIEHARKLADAHVQDIGMGFHRLCNPYHKNGICEKCWPLGIPTRDDWKEYLRQSREGHEPSPPAVQESKGRSSPYEGKKTTFFGKQSGTKEANDNTGKKYLAGLGWVVALIAFLI